MAKNYLLIKQWQNGISAPYSECVCVCVCDGAELNWIQLKCDEMICLIGFDCHPMRG